MSTATIPVCLRADGPVTGASRGLLAEAREGSREAFAEMVSPCVPALYRRARRVTGNYADAEDVRQEALLKAWSRLNQFSGTQDESNNDFRAWVARIAANSSIDLLRQRRSGQMVSLEEPQGLSAGTLSSAMASHQDNPEQRFARRQTSAILARAIAQLNPDLRQACLLRDVLQYSTQEAADHIGISVVAVRLRLFRAHRQLRDNLHQELRRPTQRISEPRVNLSRQPARARSTNQPRALSAAAAYASGD